MKNLKLEREQSKQEMSKLLDAITNMPPPAGRLKRHVFLHDTVLPIHAIDSYILFLMFVL